MSLCVLRVEENSPQQRSKLRVVFDRENPLINTSAGEKKYML